MNCLCFVFLVTAYPCYGQFTNAWIDATSSTYTANANGDMCKAINNAYVSAPFNAVIDARGFSGLQACNSPLFTANKSVTLLLPENAIVVVSWPQWTPADPHTIDGGNTGNDTNTGLIWALCGPNSHSVSSSITWNSGPSTCTFSNSFGNLTVPQFPGKISLTTITGSGTVRTATCATSQCSSFTVNQVIVVENSSRSNDNGYQTLTSVSSSQIQWAGTDMTAASGADAFSGLKFSMPHGKFPASTATISGSLVGNYACVWCDGGIGASIGSGWNNGAFDSKVRNFRIDFGGNNNVFGLYSLNVQEGSTWENIAAVDFPNDGSAPANAGVFFLDRTESPTTYGNVTIKGIHSSGTNMAVGNCSNCWGGGFEGSNTVITLNGTGCNFPPTAWVTQVSGAKPTTAAIGNNGGGACSSVTCSVSGNPSSFGALPNTSAMCTAHLTSGKVDNILFSGGSGFGPPQAGAMKYVGEMTFAGFSPTICTDPSAKCIAGGTFYDGISGGVYGETHCEFMTGNCRDIGVESAVLGGTFLATDTSPSAAGYVVHLGNGADGTQTILSTVTSLSSLILDESQSGNGGPPPIAIAGICSTPLGGGSVASYLPGVALECGQGTSLSQGWFLPETTAAPALGSFDNIFGDSSTHRLKFSNNNNPSASGPLFVVGTLTMPNALNSGNIPQLGSNGLDLTLSSPALNNAPTNTLTYAGSGGITALAGPLTSAFPGSGIGSSIFLEQEGTIPTGLSGIGEDNCYADSTQHGILCNFNAASSTLPLVQGPATSIANHFALFNATNGGLVKDLGTDFVFNPTPHSITVSSSAILDLSGATGTAALKIPTTTANTASAAGVIDYDSTNSNYHGNSGADSLFGLVPTLSIPATGDLIDASVSSSKFLLHDSGVATANVATATATLGNHVIVTGAGSKGLTVGNGDFTIDSTAHTLLAGSSGLVDFSSISGASGFKVPVQAGGISGAGGVVVYDSTGKITHIRTNDADSLAAATTSTTTTATQALFATSTAGVYTPRAIAVGDLPTIPLDKIAGATARATATESAPNDNYTFDGIETATGAYPFVIQNRSGSNNTSGALIINTGGTGTAQIPLLINETTAAGNFVDFINGGSVTNGSASGGTLEFSISAGGKITTILSYPTATASLTGVAANVGTGTDVTTKTGDLVATTWLAVPAVGAGMYRVSVYIAITTTALTSSTMPSTCILWTDRDTSSSLQVLTTASSTLNSLSTFGQASVVVDAKASTSIQIATGTNCTGGTTYASSPANAMQYKVRARVETL